MQDVADGLLVTWIEKEGRKKLNVPVFKVPASTLNMLLHPVKRKRFYGRSVFLRKP